MQPLRSLGDVKGGGTSVLAVTVGAARNAWLRADFAACIDALEPLGLRAGDTADRAEALLLHARALLRSERPLEAKQLLAPALGTFATTDGECTARMLHAAAVTRTESPERGLRLLLELVECADRLGIHRAIRTEVLHYEALAHWAERDLVRAAIAARTVESAQLDVLSVRATQLMGFIAIAEQRFHDALDIFQRALVGYRTCRDRDRNLIEHVLVQIASLEAQLRSSEVPGSFRDPKLRRVPGEAFGTACSIQRAQIAWLDAWQYAHDGNARAALRGMRDAESAAPTQPWKILALAGRAAISAGFGEAENARELGLHAAGLAAGIDWETAAGEERFVLVLLAEALAGLDITEAARVLARFDSIDSKLDDLHFAEGDPRRNALVAFVRGVVARNCGQRKRARTLLEEAYQGFEATGHRWRAALALIELDATRATEAGRGDFYLERAASIVREHFPSSFLARRLGRWGTAYTDPVAARLTRAQRQILRYALDGCGAKEIASMTGRSVKTVGNQLASLHEAFGVNSTLRLVAECHRRGIGSPDCRVGVEAGAVPQPAPRTVTG